jgi:hypothetical protein
MPKVSRKRNLTDKLTMPKVSRKRSLTDKLTMPKVSRKRNEIVRCCCKEEN